MEPETAQGQEKVTVWYDGACPLCRQEIGLLRRRDRDSALNLVDLSADPLVETPQAHDQMMARFHARDASGTLVSGAEAFLVAWAATPGLAWLGAVRRLRPVIGALDMVYGLFLRLRPSLQRWVSHVAAR